MDIEKKIFQLGKEAGLEEMEIYFSSSKGSNISYVNNEMSRFSITENQGLSLKGMYQGKFGHAYTESFSDEALKALVNQTKDNSVLIESDDPDFIYEGDEKYEDIEAVTSEFENSSSEDDIKFCNDVIKYLTTKHPSIEKVSRLSLNKKVMDTKIYNTKGLSLKKRVFEPFISFSIVAKGEKDITTSSGYALLKGRNIEEYKEKMDEVINIALSQVNPVQLESKDYKTVLSSEAATDLFYFIFNALDADMIIKKLSPFVGKIGEKVASDNITITEDPFLKESIFSTSFDDEGVVTKKKMIIEKGILKSYFNNLKTAAKLNQEPTGNASRSSFRGSMSVSPTNLVFERGNLTHDELLRKCENGVYITVLEGLHAGVNEVTGDFSLSCKGYLIKDGEQSTALNQITAAGNLFEMIKNIEELGSNLELNISSGAYYIPEMIIKSLSFSGK